MNKDPMIVDTVRIQAEKELTAERFRKAVDKCKEQLRAAKWWHKYLPFKVVIVRRKQWK